MCRSPLIIDYLHALWAKAATMAANVLKKKELRVYGEVPSDVRLYPADPDSEHHRGLKPGVGPCDYDEMQRRQYIVVSAASPSGFASLPMTMDSSSDAATLSRTQVLGRL